MKNVVEKLHLKRLKDKGIVIEDIYKQGNAIAIRTSDGKEADPVYKGPKIEKNYYVKDKLLYRETEFDHSIEYSFNSNKEKEEECSECGYKATSSNFFDGCPYCGSQFNIEYSSTKKSTSGKVKAIITKKNTGKLIFVFLIISIIAGIISTIMNDSISVGYDVAFIVFQCLIYITAVYFPIYLIIKIMTTKDFPNSSIKIYGKEISNIHLLKDMQSELKIYYYNDNPQYLDLIDYDILEYVDYQLHCNSPSSVRISFIIKVREYYFKDNEINTRTITKNLTMLRNVNYVENHDKMRKCPSCGAAIEGVKENCDYCHNKLPSNKLWLLESIL